MTKRCPECNEENADAAIECACGAPLDDGDNDAVGASGDDDADEEWDDDDLEPDKPEAPEAEREFEFREWTAPPEEPPPELDPEAAARAERAAQAAREAAILSETFLAEISRYAPNPRRRIILMFGFSQSGKTFFVHRAKHEDTNLDYGNTFPDNDSDESGGHHIEGTRGLKLHTMDNGEKDWVVLLDVAGEMFANAIKNNFEGVDSVFLRAIALADGFIFMAPSAQLLLTKGADETELRRLRRSIDYITAFVNLVDQRLDVPKGATAPSILEIVTEFQALKQEEIEDVRRRSGRSKKPALVLLSKADRYGADVKAQGKRWADFFDGDPIGRMVHAQSSHPRLMLQSLCRRFRDFRVDFVTVAEGQADNDEIFRPLTTGHYGVKENFIWLRKAIDRSRKQILRKLHPGVAPAIFIRRMMDSDFRKVWRGGV